MLPPGEPRDLPYKRSIDVCVVPTPIRPQTLVFMPGEQIVVVERSWGGSGATARTIRADGRSTGQAMTRRATVVVSFACLAFGGCGGDSSGESSSAPAPLAQPPAGATIVATISVGGRPGGIVVGEGAVWVKNHADETVSRINPRTNEVTATIRIGRGQFGYLAAGEGSIWATNNDANTVSRIDPRSNKVVATIRVGDNPQGIAVGSGSVWVANHRAGSVSRIDVATNRVSAVIKGADLCCSPQAVATSSEAVWVTVPDKGHVVMIDPTANRVVSKLGVNENGGRLAVTEDAVWAATGTRIVAKIDPATNTESTKIDAGAGATAFGAAAGLDSIWVTNPGVSLIRIDPRENRVVGVLKVPGAVFPAVGEGGVWVSSETTNTVVRVEPAQ